MASGLSRQNNVARVRTRGTSKDVCTIPIRKMTAAKADAHDAFEHLFYILILHMCAVPSDLTAAVSIGHLRIRDRAGAKAWPVVASVITCLMLSAVLFYNMAVTAPSSAIDRKSTRL